MTLKIFAALTLAAALTCAAPLAQAHEGHHHGAKTKKVKKTKEQKKTGATIRFVVRPAVVQRAGASKKNTFVGIRLTSR